MNVEFKEKRVITSLNINVIDGSFALDSSPLAFETCRERFAAHFKESTSSLFFKHPADRGENIAAFILRTEQILKEEEKSQFAMTNWNTVLSVEPSNFWRACPMRRSFFTILLRAGMNYDFTRNNYEDSLFSERYVVPTRRAVMRFLFGFTKYVGPELIGSATLLTAGWRTVFSDLDDFQIKSMLIWPAEHGKYVPQADLTSAMWV